MEEIELVDEDVRFSLPAELTGARFDERIRTESENTLEAAAEAAMRAAAAAYLAGVAGSATATGAPELTADTTLESDYILFQLWLYPPSRRRCGSRPRGR